MIDYQFKITDLSQFCLFSKILGKKMYKRLLLFITASSILANNQYGFRANHSTYMALLKTFDQITKELDNKQISLGIFIDLSKAFDTLDPEMLISKLNHYDIRGTAKK